MSTATQWAVLFCAECSRAFDVDSHRRHNGPPTCPECRRARKTAYQKRWRQASRRQRVRA